MKKILILFLLGLTIFSNKALQAQWIQTNGPYCGIVNTIAVSPYGMGGKNLFAGTNNGLFRSTDNGKSWVSVGAGQTRNLVYCLAIDSVADSTFKGAKLYAGTDYNAIFLSTDYGTNWAQVNTKYMMGWNISSFLVRGHKLYAANEYGDIYFSTDNGTTWSWVSSDIGKAGNAGAIYLADDKENIFAAAYNGHIYMSSNEGINWTSIGKSELLMYSKSIVTVPNKSGGTNLFVGTDGRGIFLTTNNGINWTKVDSGLTDLTILSFAVISKLGETYIYAGTENGVFLSTNNGKSWSSVSGLSNKSILSLTVSSDSSGANLWAGTNGHGAYYMSVDSGIHWRNASSGLGYESVHSFTFSNDITDTSSGKTYLFAGTENGIFLTTDDGADWVETDSGLTNLQVYSLISVDNGTGGKNIYAGTHKGVFFSKNNGKSWAELDSSFKDLWVISFIANKNKAGEKNIFAGTYGGGVYISTDNGAKWSSVNTGLTHINLNVRSLACADSSLYAGTDNGIVVSTNSGASWVSLKSNMKFSQIYFLYSFDFGSKNMFTKTVDGIFRSTDCGKNWSLDSSLTYWNVNYIALSPNGSGGNNLIAGTTYSGLIRSSDYGRTWTQLNSGLTNLHVGPIIVGETNIFANTRSGVWRLPLSESITGVANKGKYLPANFSLEQNYPNPFNPSTTIKYSIPKLSFVSIKVFDILGREVASLVNQEKSKGDYKIRFDGSFLTSGIYLYRLQAGNFTETKKFILLK